MWRQIAEERKHTSEKWKKVNDDYVRCVMSPAGPFVVVQSGQMIPKSTTAEASKDPELSIAPSAPDNSENEVKTIDLSEEEGSSEPEKGNEGKSAPYGKGHPSQSEDTEENTNAVVKVENENPSEDFLIFSEISSLVDLFKEENGTEYDQGDEKQQGAMRGTEEEEKNESGQAEDVAALSENNGAHGETTGELFSEEQLCEIFDNLTKILTGEDTQTIGSFERKPTNIMKSKKPRKKNKKRHH